VIVQASWAGTAAFPLTAVGAAVAPSAMKPVALAVAAALFAAGCGVFLWAFLLTAGRSRTEAVELAQVWFLTGPSTPRAVRRSLLGALAVQVVVGLVTAAVRPYTSLAAGVLVPMWGLGLCGLWAARHATFPPRPPDPRRRRTDVRSVDADHREQDP
jgi:hypothetical protein